MATSTDHGQSRGSGERPKIKSGGGGGTGGGGGGIIVIGCALIGTAIGAAFVAARRGRGSSSSSQRGGRGRRVVDHEEEKGLPALLPPAHPREREASSVDCQESASDKSEMRDDEGSEAATVDSSTESVAEVVWPSEVIEQQKDLNGLKQTSQVSENYREQEFSFDTSVQIQETVCEDQETVNQIEADIVGSIESSIPEQGLAESGIARVPEEGKPKPKEEGEKREKASAETKEMPQQVEISEKTENEGSTRPLHSIEQQNGHILLDSSERTQGNDCSDLVTETEASETHNTSDNFEVVAETGENQSETYMNVDIEESDVSRIEEEQGTLSIDYEEGEKSEESSDRVVLPADVIVRGDEQQQEEQGDGEQEELPLTVMNEIEEKEYTSEKMEFLQHLTPSMDIPEQENGSLLDTSKENEGSSCNGFKNAEIAVEAKEKQSEADTSHDEEEEEGISGNFQDTKYNDNLVQASLSSGVESEDSKVVNVEAVVVVKQEQEEQGDDKQESPSVKSLKEEKMLDVEEENEREESIVTDSSSKEFDFDVNKTGIDWAEIGDESQEGGSVKCLSEEICSALDEGNEREEETMLNVEVENEREESKEKNTGVDTEDSEIVRVDGDNKQEGSSVKSLEGEIVSVAEEEIEREESIRTVNSSIEFDTKGVWPAELVQLENGPVPMCEMRQLPIDMERINLIVGAEQAEGENHTTEVIQSFLISDNKRREISGEDAEEIESTSMELQEAEIESSTDGDSETETREPEEEKDSFSQTEDVEKEGLPLFETEMKLQSEIAKKTMGIVEEVHEEEVTDKEKIMDFILTGSSKVFLLVMALILSLGLLALAHLDHLHHYEHRLPEIYRQLNQLLFPSRNRVYIDEL